MNDPFADIRDMRMGDLNAEQTNRALECWLRANLLYANKDDQPHYDPLFRVIDRLRAPIDMVLHCPACGLQHIDGAETMPAAGSPHWDNPPHRSHLCGRCGHVWRPADVPTNGVACVKTIGKADSPVVVHETPNLIDNMRSGQSVSDKDIDALCAPGRASRWNGDGRQYDRDTVRLALDHFAPTSLLASEPASEQIDDAAIELALSALEGISRKQRQFTDTIEPVRTINDAAKIASAAYARLHQAVVRRDYEREKAASVLATSPAAETVGAWEP